MIVALASCSSSATRQTGPGWREVDGVSPCPMPPSTVRSRRQIRRLAAAIAKWWNALIRSRGRDYFTLRFDLEQQFGLRSDEVTSVRRCLIGAEFPASHERIWVLESDAYGPTLLDVDLETVVVVDERDVRRALGSPVSSRVERDHELVRDAGRIGRCTAAPACTRPARGAWSSLRQGHAVVRTETERDVLRAGAGGCGWADGLRGFGWRRIFDPHRAQDFGEKRRTSGATSHLSSAFPKYRISTGMLGIPASSAARTR